MKKWLLALVLALAVPVSAQQYLTTTEVTIAGTAVNLFTAAQVQQGNGHPQATSATCSLAAANIRVSWDGQAPTTSFGEVLTPGYWVVTGPDVLLNIQGIRDDSTSATWSCTLNYGGGR